FFKPAKKMGRPPLHSLRSFHYERPIFPLAAETAFTETTLHYQYFAPFFPMIVVGMVLESESSTIK
ncbi:MAG: hypothetical protein ABGX16_08750, partial [Pirellulales bacterium]